MKTRLFFSKNEFYNVFLSKLEYPKEAKEKGIRGTVYYQIKIDTNGFIASFMILRGVYPDLDEEVKKKIYLSDGKWNPVFKEGKKVNFTVIERKCLFRIKIIIKKRVSIIEALFLMVDFFS